LFVIWSLIIGHCLSFGTWYLLAHRSLGEGGVINSIWSLSLVYQ